MKAGEKLTRFYFTPCGATISGYAMLRCNDCRQEGIMFPKTGLSIAHTKGCVIATAIREPVASPQATRPECKRAWCARPHNHEGPCSISPDDFTNAHYRNRAAQPAAGTTPHIHECDHETEGEHVCRCVICGKHIGTPPSEGTTPQAERPASALFTAEGAPKLIQEECKHGNTMCLICFAEARAVAPVETPDGTWPEQMGKGVFDYSHPDTGTRLTAEQFLARQGFADSVAHSSVAIARLLEAFRDKSESERSPFAAHNWQHWNEMCKTAQEQARAALGLVAGLREEIERLKADHQVEIARYRNTIDLMSRCENGEVWYWADDGEDHPETLACPALIQPDVVRRFVAAEAELAALRERERERP